ncbi:MAG: hypothetical protein ABIN58_10905 [candidate division WOR-3 bacterium]
MGTLPIPAEGQSFEAAYAQAAEYAEFVPVWGKPSPFYRMADDLAGSWGKTFVDEYTYGNGMFPIVHLTFMGEEMSLAAPPELDNATLSDPAWRSAYKETALEIVRVAHPPYLSLGNEVNRWYEKYGAELPDPNGFQHFVSLYEETYNAVKAVSPETNVFCTFAREIISEHRPANLEVLTMFDPNHLDLLALTSYPYTVQGIRSPSDIPHDYYSKALAHTPGLSLALIEVGWPSLEALGGEAAQRDFLAQAVGRLTREQGIPLNLVGWAWLHDINPNDTMGLLRRDNSPKAAYEIWKALSTSEPQESPQ